MIYLFIFSSNKTLKLFVANYDGLVSIYEVNTTDGGECRQISQYLLFNMTQNPKNEQTSPIGAGRGKFLDNIHQSFGRYFPL
jgi:hypothetical protein